MLRGSDGADDGPHPERRYCRMRRSMFLRLNFHIRKAVMRSFAFAKLGGPDECEAAYGTKYSVKWRYRGFPFVTSKSYFPCSLSSRPVNKIGLVSQPQAR